MSNMDSFMTFVLVICSLIIYDVYCTDVDKHNSWPNNDSVSGNGNVQASSFNLSEIGWPSLKPSQTFQPDSNRVLTNRHNGRSRNRNRNRNHSTSNFSSSGSQNNEIHTKDLNSAKPTNNVEDDELRQFSEELFKRDINNAMQYISIDWQGKTSSSSSEDKAPLPLLNVSTSVNQILTISKLKRLHNNYIPYTDKDEQVTNAEKQEERELLDAFLNTPVMNYTRNFLISKGAISQNLTQFKDQLHKIWFKLYSRSNGRKGSSGFEHIFLGEIRNNEVTGLHNWVFFNSEELKNTINYLGYLKIVDLNKKGYILKHHFTYNGADKPVDSMFIGTSPEFEMALYSTCFFLRPNQVCPLQLEGRRFIVRAFTIKYDNSTLIGSAFPEI